MTHLKRKLMMTLALLLTAATGAWAESKPIGLNVEYEAGDEITSTTDVYVYYGEHPTNHKQMGVKITSTQPLKILMINAHGFELNGDAAVYYLPDGDAEGGYAGGISCFGESTGDATVVHVASGSGTLADPYVFGSGPSGTPVPLTRGTGEKINEWTLTNDMPAGNVTVKVKYFAQAEFAMSTDETPVALAPTAIPDVPANTDGAIVEAGTVANIGTSEVKQGTLMYFVKQADGNTAPTAPTYDTEGWSENVPTADGLQEGKAYVWYYIEGAEPTSGERTDDNTRSDSDIKPLGTTGFVTLEAEPTYDVSLNKTGMAEGEPALWSAKSTNVTTAVNLGEADLEGVKKGETVTVTYSGDRKIIGVKAEKAEEPVTLATPLTIEAITAGTIQVNTNGTLSTGMKYSVNGDTPTLITTTTGITVAKGDKVQFYSNGTSNSAYSNGPEVKISGGTAEVKVYGNIMSLLDETDFATMTDLPNNANYAFFGLFMENTTLIDASELLLPAATLAAACYQQMFQGCTSLTKAPKLPATTLDQYCYYSMFYDCKLLTAAPELPAATWLAAGCYAQMFSGCTSLTSAYVKAAYKNESDECAGMFDGCTASGAVLHTTSGNKASWEGVMGTGKTWSTWSVADDWQD